MKLHFGKDLVGVLLFGSQITGRATDQSDLDMLIVLSEARPLNRSLYRWWDEKMPNPDGCVLSPQFVHLPTSPEAAGGLWFEVASASRILCEEGRKTSHFLEKVRCCIEDDKIRRHWTNGQPYWVWKDRNNAQQGSGL